MRWSRAFLPVLKESPSDAQIVSHKLMLRAGLIRQTAAGIYAWLPLGFRVLKKIEQIVREEQDRAGAVELLMPTIQSADLWRESGRYDAYGPEMLRFLDRRGSEMLYGPTNEEMITIIFRDAVKSYRDLPRTLYHIQWKFRDEIRPRFGVMRGREFLMKDAYSFDLDEAGLRASYEAMFVAYLRTFARMGLSAVPVRAQARTSSPKSTSTGGRLPIRRVVGWPMTLTCGFSHAAMNRLVISVRESSKCECTEATQMSNPARKSASQSTEPSGPMLSSVPCSSTRPPARCAASARTCSR